MEGLSVHVTEAFVEPATLAVNCWVCELNKVAETGLMLTTVAGTRVMIALADLVESAELVAVIVTLWVALMLDGAVYKPLADTVPTAGFNVQVTAVFVLPVTLVVNCWVWEADRLIEAGLTVTATGGVRVTIALANLLAFAALVAVIVTVWLALMLDGAV
jgi:hypothetical protein